MISHANKLPRPLVDGKLAFREPRDVWDHIDIAMVRDRPEWDVPLLDGITVQLGAGNKIIESAVNLDFPDWDAHALGAGSAAAWRLPFDDSSVGGFISYHTLDHLEPWAVVRLLTEIQRCLLVGGTFVNIVPHGDSQLAKECIMHKSRFMVDTFRNIFSERQYDHSADGVKVDSWRFEIGHNFIYGITERNTVLVTQLVRV